MRTTLDIDGELLDKARELTGTSTKTETVEKGLRALIRESSRQNLLEMEGAGYGMTREEFLESRRDE